MNTVIFDWLSLTTRIHSVNDLISILGLSSETVVWETVKGAHGYRDRLYFGGISLHYNGRDDMGIWLEMSGQGCRSFETYGTGDYAALFELALDEPEDVHITRLDVAYDDHSGILDIGEICDDVRAGNYVSRFRGWQVVDGSDGQSVTLGSRSSEVLVRIYDKAAERGLEDGSHWVRCELQLRRDRALEYVKLGSAAGDSFRGVLLNYLRFVEPCGDDTNKWRWPMRDYWSDLVGDAARISVYARPGVEYNLGNLCNFVVEQAGNAIKTYTMIFGWYDLQQALKERRSQLSPTYRRLIDDYSALPPTQQNF